MKFLIVFAFFVVVTYVDAAVPTNTIIAAYESIKYSQKHPKTTLPTTIRPSYTPQRITFRSHQHRHNFIAAAGAMITKFVKNVPKVI